MEETQASSSELQREGGNSESVQEGGSANRQQVKRKLQPDSTLPGKPHDRFKRPCFGVTKDEPSSPNLDIRLSGLSLDQSLLDKRERTESHTKKLSDEHTYDHGLGAAEDGAPINQPSEVPTETKPEHEGGSANQDSPESESRTSATDAGTNSSSGQQTKLHDEKARSQSDISRKQFIEDVYVDYVKNEFTLKSLGPRSITTDPFVNTEFEVPFTNKSYRLVRDGVVYNAEGATVEEAHLEGACLPGNHSEPPDNHQNFVQRLRAWGARTGKMMRVDCTEMTFDLVDNVFVQEDGKTLAEAGICAGREVDVTRTKVLSRQEGVKMAMYSATIPDPECGSLEPWVWFEIYPPPLVVDLPSADQMRTPPPPEKAPLAYITTAFAFPATKAVLHFRRPATQGEAPCWRPKGSPCAGHRLRVHNIPSVDNTNDDTARTTRNWARAWRRQLRLACREHLNKWDDIFDKMATGSVILRVVLSGRPWQRYEGEEKWKPSKEPPSGLQQPPSQTQTPRWQPGQAPKGGEDFKPKEGSGLRNEVHLD